MSKPKSEIPVSPLVLSKEEVAKLLGRGATQFDKLLPRLNEIGFPQPDPVLGGWYISAVRQWIDRRYTLDKSQAETDEDLFLQNARDQDGDDQSAVPGH